MKLVYFILQQNYNHCHYSLSSYDFAIYVIFYASVVLLFDRGRHVICFDTVNQIYHLVCTKINSTSHA